MKFTVNMKCPDALHEAIRYAVRKEVATFVLTYPEEREAIEAMRCKAANDLCGRWFKYGEYLCVEVDTEAKTCVVIPSNP